MPTDPNARYEFACSSGSSRENTFEPSRGGMGIRLKIAKSKLYWTTMYKNQPTNAGDATCVALSNRKRAAAVIAKSTFVIGPARATRATSFLPSLRLNGSTGTGFAPPKIMGEPERIRARGSKIVINMSMCGRGSSVSLPASRAVGSPKRSATRPCATSCRMAENIRITSPIRSSILFPLYVYDIIFVLWHTFATCAEKEEWLASNTSIIPVLRVDAGKDAHQKPKKYFGQIFTGQELPLMVDSSDLGCVQSAREWPKMQ